VLKPADSGPARYDVRRLKESRQARAAIEGLLRELGAPPARLPALDNASHGPAVRVITWTTCAISRPTAKYTRVVTAAEESLIRKPIKELCDELDPSSFWQIHRSTMSTFTPSGGGADLRGHTQVRLKRREELLAVSDAYAHRFRQM